MERVIRYRVESVSDNGRDWFGVFATLSEAIDCYAKFVDHGFADSLRVIYLKDPDGNVMASKELRRPA